jgi:alpha-galactosidase
MNRRHTATQTGLLVFSLLAAVSLAAESRAAETMWLSSLDLSKCTQGFGKPQADKSITEKTLSIAGRTFDKGLGTHAASRLLIDLKGGSSRFVAWVGVDDGAKSGGEKAAPIEFQIIGDGRKLFKSGIMKAGDAAKQVDLDVKGVKTLLLLVKPAGDGIGWAHADWADARFEITGDRPETIRRAAEKPEILTPKPSPKPRINGTRVFGVRPGSPFLFTIAATGDRPMGFGAEGLPAGLKIDPATGQITGSVAERGEHVVTLKATNTLGTAEGRLRIVVGDTVALTPHMGWNSWYCHVDRVSDEIMRQAADAMVSTGMIDHGYMYVNIDDCWAVKPDSKDPMLAGEPRDADGRINPNKKFPNMKAMTDYIHSKGLKAGIYTSPGPQTCAGYVGAYQHEEQDARTFAEWGFDFLKYDWCSYGKIAKDNSVPELRKPYEVMRDALRKQKRDLVFNLCQYGMGDVWRWGKDVGGNSWRTNRDIGMPGDMGASIFRIGFAQNGLELWAGPGHWNDPDYLLLGWVTNWNGTMAPTELTPNEQYSYMSLWSLLASPLILGGDITRLDEFTLNVLCNDEIIEVNQDRLGRQGRRVAEGEDQQVWSRDLEDGSKAVGLFNTGEFAASVTARWSDLKIRGKQKVRDLWRQRELGTMDGEFSASIPSRGVVMVRMWPAR